MENEAKATQEPVRRLLCAVCGAETRGRQWPNRDTGFGLCERSAEWLAERGMAPEEMRRLYGDRGVHYAVAPPATATA